MKKYIGYFVSVLFIVLISSCSRKYAEADAFGVFEAEEIILASQAEGIVVDFDVEQGSKIQSGQYIASIDSNRLVMQKQQLLLQINAFWSQYEAMVAKKFRNLNDSLVNVENLIFANEYKKDLSDSLDSLIQQKQDIESAIISWKKGQSKQVEILALQVEQLYIQLRQLNEAIAKCRIVSPIDGIILSKYVHQYELTGLGRPIVCLANLDEMTLKVYVSEDQLSSLELGKTCEVRIDAIDGEMEVYEGQISWISSQSEFTPKMIQTKKERVNLVYGVNIKVKNNGKIKIGMPGEVTF